MNTQHDELVRLVGEEPPSRTAPDVTAIRRAGRRIRTRRRVAAGLASVAVVAAIGVPAALTAQDDGPRPGPAAGTGPATSSASDATTPPTATPTPPGATEQDLLTPPTGHTLEPGLADTPTCGVMVCRSERPARHRPESGTVLGEVLPMGTFDGATEVLYAARVPGTDLRTGEPAEVDVLMAGIDDGTLRRTVWSLQPGTEPRRSPVHVYGGTKAADEDGTGFHYGVIGYVEGEHDAVEVTLPDGTTRPVSGSSTEVLPGWTVFHDTGAWLDGWTGSPAELTYGVPGGPSCSTTECGALG